MKTKINTTFKSLLGFVICALPLASNAQNSVFDIIQNSPNHTILEAGLIQANLDSVLSDTTSQILTVFAPDDSAFYAYFNANGITSADLLADPKLSNILLHHVVSGNVLSTSLSNGEVTTLSGLDVTVDTTNGVMIDNAMVTAADLTAPNGVVHVINDILLPTFDDLTEIISTSPDHTILLTALQTANLVGTLQGAGPFTVFAPTDAAFTAYLAANGLTAADLLANPKLSNILLHHVVSGNVLSTSLSNGEVTTLSGLDVTVDTTNGVMIDNAMVTAADLTAPNGVVHVINDILLPTFDDLTEIISTSPDHTILLTALQTANLVGTLQGAGPFTVFAPTDAAFTAYLAANGLTAADLLANPKLSNILLHHVVSGSVLSTSLSNGEVTTLSGLDVTVDLTNGVVIDNAKVTVADIAADNGVVHVINDILLPTYDDVTEVITTSPEHTVLLQALQAANLVSTLQGAGPFTVFAPTDAAFTAFLTANNLTAAALLADPNLSSILLNHVVGAKVLSTDLSNGNVTTLNNTDVVVDLTNGVMIDNANVTAADIVADNGVVHVIDGILVPANPSTGLFNDSKNAEFKIYPNPTQNNLKINLGKNEKYSIMNITGSIVQSGQLVNGVVNVEGLKKGIYLIQVNNEEGLRDAKFTKE